jgi:5S rRNA maturation endonuclease (ribonuclease M5)
MNYEKTLEDFEKNITELIEENKKVAIIVEGEKDKQALNKLGVHGIIISYNLGMSIANFCDMISQNHKEVIILTDWDRKGGFLCSTIRKNLEGRVKINTEYRKFFAKNSKTRTIEGLPSWIELLKNKINEGKKLSR